MNVRNTSCVDGGNHRVPDSGIQLASGSTQSTGSKADHYFLLVYSRRTGPAGRGMIFRSTDAFARDEVS
jgi:hypothetical protein